MSGLIAAAMYHAAKKETSELYVQATLDPDWQSRLIL
jgi:hypothetical protein